MDDPKRRCVSLSVTDGDEYIESFLAAQRNRSASLRVLIRCFLSNCKEADAAHSDIGDVLRAMTPEHVAAAYTAEVRQESETATARRSRFDEVVHRPRKAVKPVETDETDDVPEVTDEIPPVVDEIPAAEPVRNARSETNRLYGGGTQIDGPEALLGDVDMASFMGEGA